MKTTNPLALKQSYSYEDYRSLIYKLFESGKTTGENHSAEMLANTKLNIHRMDRLDKTIQLSDALVQSLKTISHPQTWLLISEAWCPDSAQNTPIIAKMAEVNPVIRLRIILRDQNPDIMDRFLTNGARSIPKLVLFDHNQQIVGEWGPRPAELIEKIAENKNSLNPVPKEEFSKTIQLWYASNKGQALQDEMIEILKS